MTSTETPPCLLVNGMPGAGKSTVTRLASRLLPRAARIDGDVVTRLVVSGRVWALGEPADEAARQVDLCNRNLCSLAANFADAAFTPFIDSIIPERRQLDFFREQLAPRPVLLVTLAPGIDACVYRNSIRDPEEQFFFDGYEALQQQMHDELGDVGWWFDTSQLTAEETAAQIIAEAGERALLKPR